MRSPTARSARYGDFQVTPTATSRSSRPNCRSTRLRQRGLHEVYRYDAGRERARLRLLPAHRKQPPTADAALPRTGSGLTDDGRVFFNSADQLVLRDTNSKLDAYEWKDGRLVS